DKVVLEDVSHPLGIRFVCFLAPDSFHIFGVSKDNVAGGFQDVVDGNPILPCGLHTDIPAAILSQPRCAPMQISGEGRKTLALVACYPLFIGGSDTGNNKGLVDIHPAADTVNNFEHNTSPRNSI